MFSRKALFAFVATIVAVPSLAFVSVKSYRANGLTASDCNTCGIASASTFKSNPSPDPRLPSCAHCIPNGCTNLNPGETVWPIVQGTMTVRRCVNWDTDPQGHCAWVVQEEYHIYDPELYPVGYCYKDRCAEGTVITPYINCQNPQQLP